MFSQMREYLSSGLDVDNFKMEAKQLMYYGQKSKLEKGFETQGELRAGKAS